MGLQCSNLDPEARVKFFPKSHEVTSLKCDLIVCIARDTAAIFAAFSLQHAEDHHTLVGLNGGLS